MDNPKKRTSLVPVYATVASSLGFLAFGLYGLFALLMGGPDAVVFFPMKSSGPDELAAIWAVVIGLGLAAAGGFVAFSIRRAMLTGAAAPSDTA